MSEQSYSILDNLPSGFKLRHTLQGMGDKIAWSPDGRMIASFDDRTITIWDMQIAQQSHHIAYAGVQCIDWHPTKCVLFFSLGHKIESYDLETGQTASFASEQLFWVTELAWSPDGKTLAAIDGPSVDFWIWNNALEQYERYPGLTMVDDLIPRYIAWSSNGQILAIAGRTVIYLWSVTERKYLETLTGHIDTITCLAWLPSTNNILASGSVDRTIRIWQSQTMPYILEVHTASVSSLTFSHEGNLLASYSQDGVIHIRRTDTWELVETLAPLTSGSETQSWITPETRMVTFHPSTPTLLIGDLFLIPVNLAYIVDLDIKAIHHSKKMELVHYTSAKVVLVGESGVGKSGLYRVLTGRPFAPTDSTHGRQIQLLDKEEVDGDGEVKELRETLLWDLAGQPDYRLIHQLHLSEVTVALLVFDASREADTFTNVRYWNRALRLAQLASGNTTHPLKKILVAARLDRGGLNVTIDHVRSLAQELGCSSYVGTSAKENLNVAELRKAVIAAIAWNELPKVISTELFRQIKMFLTIEQQTRLLYTEQEIYCAFLQAKSIPDDSKELRAQFETCLGHVAASGLIRRFGFGNLVLLQPELLDNYASALLITVKNEAHGLGSISEERVREGDFFVPQEEKLREREDEKLLLVAMIEEILRQELVLREHGELIFPSHFSLEYTDLTDAKGKAVSIRFEGSVLNIYTMLVVRLSHSDIFKKHELWKNAVTYTTIIGGIYGMLLHKQTEDNAELILFFDQAASWDMRFHFEEYIYKYLQQHALPQSVLRKYLFVCPECGVPFSDLQVAMRRERGFDWLLCNVCGYHVSLVDRGMQCVSPPPSRIKEMSQAADNQRDREAAQLQLRGKIMTNDFDVLLCYNPHDLEAVKEIGELLKVHGILPWLDVWEAQPGRSWQQCLQEQIEHVRSIAVFVGSNGLGSWEYLQIEAFIRQFVENGCPVIPVILAGAPHEPALPHFLKGMIWVDFRKQQPDPLEQLMWGITGKQMSRVDVPKVKV